ncbi:carboxylating nicotinate-nucleotide diphosphorylase [Candidatus Poribacteria bacterium]|nr:carboxylating nicotinate-nucleotide diphosphorylase [Candidatus Poribacteria bacterium]
MKITYSSELKIQIQYLINLALAEDCVENDITSHFTIPSAHESKAKIIALEHGKLAGIKIVEQTFKTINQDIKFKYLKRDGDDIEKGTILGVVKGKTKDLLAGERTALNFLQHLSGIATLTQKYVNLIPFSKTKILDTRKTLPGWRYLEKYAVLIGGGYNHRKNLSDLILIKDNHIKAAGGVSKALTLIYKKNNHKNIKVEIEVETLSEVKECLNFPIDIIMLDNMDIPKLKKAIEIINGKCMIEVSGRVNLSNIQNIAKYGVDYISIGKLTSSAPTLDIHMEFDN